MMGCKRLLQVTPCNDAGLSGKKVQVKYSAVPLSKLAEKRDQLVDVIAMIEEVHPVIEVSKWNNTINF